MVLPTPRPDPCAYTGQPATGPSVGDGYSEVTLLLKALVLLKPNSHCLPTPGHTGMRISERESRLAKQLLDKSQRPKKPNLISEASVLGEYLTQGTRCPQSRERGTVVGEAPSDGSADPQLTAQMGRHLGLPRDLRTSSGQGFKVLYKLSGIQLLVPFSFPYAPLNDPGQGAGRAFTTVEGTTPDRLTLSQILSHLDEAEQDDEGQGQQLGSREGILNTGSSLHTVAVHSSEQHCGEGQRERANHESPQGRRSSPGSQHREGQVLAGIPQRQSPACLPMGSDFLRLVLIKLAGSLGPGSKVRNTNSSKSLILAALDSLQRLFFFFFK